MKFFLPYTENKKEAESDLKSIEAFVHGTIPEPRIYRLMYRHNGKEMAAQVGDPADSYYKEGNQPVIAIIQAGAGYAVCLPFRGAVKGDPIMVGFNSPLCQPSCPVGDFA
ncbi:hypothetical protein [Marinobacter sp. ELB17]|uniref:hypothetical protein n=1 Tax=Marinobacter sp. ELB17 TaxID=270374 RepID=UPI0000F3ABC9|nr:hypothetical protein [Marinobacter sp. ELB17]EAZ97158.1 hypothetical protein MELB17_11018 [Marinobacter sp. ELB17]